ncbi:hypothetical protein HYDPIDRAFT_167784 [Hydnomerulius pinastri MD-312]|uniref:Uncharacterized protein n=1 Tax=Hydnomerulius pinastri MD-312 TaxID=994086 RepID=A0A0C9WFT2_9AGAM|nr:hypothetical protein HYDPIDRAFT_167784 [Hydnomerulius pinastri MD-312]
MPPVEDAELIERIRATNAGDKENDLSAWTCRRCKKNDGGTNSRATSSVTSGREQSTTSVSSDATVISPRSSTGVEVGPNSSSATKPPSQRVVAPKAAGQPLVVRLESGLHLGARPTVDLGPIGADAGQISVKQVMSPRTFSAKRAKPAISTTQPPLKVHVPTKRSYEQRSQPPAEDAEMTDVDAPSEKHLDSPTREKMLSQVPLVPPRAISSDDSRQLTTPSLGALEDDQMEVQISPATSFMHGSQSALHAANRPTSRSRVTSIEATVNKQPSTCIATPVQSRNEQGPSQPRIQPTSPLSGRPSRAPSVQIQQPANNEDVNMQDQGADDDDDDDLYGPPVERRIIRILPSLAEELREQRRAKLGKAALLAKLVEVATPANTNRAPPMPSNDVRSESALVVPRPAASRAAEKGTADSPPDPVKSIRVPVPEHTAHRRLLPTNAYRAHISETRLPTTPHRLHSSVSAATRIEPSSAVAGAKRSVHAEPPAPQKRIKTALPHNKSPAIALAPTPILVGSQPRDTQLPQDQPVTKKLAHTDAPAAEKRPRTDSTCDHTPKATLVAHATSTFKPALPRQVPSATLIFKAPGLPATARGGTIQAKVSTAKYPGYTSLHGIPASGRFKSLITSSKLPPKGQGQVRLNDSTPIALPTASNALGSHSGLTFPTIYIPPLLNISLPPKASERKRVHRWAIILSVLTDEDRKVCSLVSRMFRYAVYLSAAHILSKKYSGQRLTAIFEQYSQSMTNMWPYLRLRDREVSSRRQVYKQSFLGRYRDSISFDPLSERLWSSPDNEKQVQMALRYVLTRMWFAVSVGSYGHDSSTWAKSVVKDVQEIVKGQIWQVDVQCSGTTEAFYVLETTCEVIGHPPSLALSELASRSIVRSDWSAYISPHLLQGSLSTVPGRGSLQDSIKWSNSEDYDRGISKAWLRRVSDEGEIGASKRIVAEKYIMACVVSNGISGQWMSSSAMAQEFAGLPNNDTPNSRPTARSVNMYLPAHHHVESIHFAMSKGQDLHPAVAVVQTPSREYFVLRDNGMQGPVTYDIHSSPVVVLSTLFCSAVNMPSVAVVPLLWGL